MNAIRVLLVDDREAARRDLRGLLERADSRIVIAGTAGSIPEALAAIWERKPHVVVLDLAVARASSLDHLHEMRRVRPVEVLIFTAARDPEKYRRAIERGAFAVVARDKPAELLRAIERAHAAHEAPPPAFPARWAHERVHAASLR